MTPTSQKYRQIAFQLTGGAAAPLTFTFVIRPEELSRTEPSRLQVQQTLGGAWVDTFGQGVSSITLSGHNGWRGGLLQDGETLFAALRQAVYVGWHQRRATLISQGQDPSAVELLFTDSLDSIRAVVAPVSFTLRRSRTDPLLMRYQIQLVQTADPAASTSLIDEIVDALSNPLRFLTGITGLADVVSNLQSYATQAQNVLGSISTSVGDFLALGPDLFNAVGTIAADAQGSFTGVDSLVLSVAKSYASAGANAFYALAADDTLPSASRLPLMATASAYNDATCIMANSFNTSGLNFTLITPFQGASTCSSTAGGDDPSAFAAPGANAFESLYTAAEAPVTITTAANAALLSLNGDPLGLIGQTQAIGTNMATAAEGITVA